MRYKVSSLAGANLRGFPSGSLGAVLVRLERETVVESVPELPDVVNTAGTPTSYVPVRWKGKVGWVAGELLQELPSIRETYRKYIGCVHMGDGYGKVSTITSLKNAIDCNRSACLAAQEAGFLPVGMILKHTKAGGVKKCIADAVNLPSGAEKYYRFYWADKLLTDIKLDKLVEGALLFYDSDTAILGGDGYIYSCNKAQGYKYKAESDYRIRIGDKTRYVGKSKVLVIAVPVR